MPVNATSALDRFTLGAGRSRSFSNIAENSVVADRAGNLWDIDVNGDVLLNMDGTMAGSAATVALQTQQDVAVLPVTAVAASKVFTFTAATLALTAASAGVAGNAITLRILNTGGDVVTAVVAVTGTAITVTPVQSGGVIADTVSVTADNIMGFPAAAALVTAVAAGTTPEVTTVEATAATPLAGGVTGVTSVPVGTWVTVSSVTVVGDGYAVLTGQTGKYARIIQTSGAGVVHIRAFPHRRVNPLVGLGAA